VLQRIRDVGGDPPILKVVLSPKGSQYEPINVNCLHILDVWQQAQWVLWQDVARQYGLNRKCFRHYVKGGIVHRVRTGLREHDGHCIHYLEALHLGYLLQVRKLVGWFNMSWALTKTWGALGPEAITAEAARRAMEDSKL